MSQQIISKKKMLTLLSKHDRGAWTRTTTQVSCAANTGDSGWREVYNNGEQDVAAVEYPNARYKVVCFSLV